MNTKKGKGKNRQNKPPNPNPPQKIEVDKIPEKVDDSVIENVESETNIEKRVPEIISDIVAPTEEVKSVDEPKKPKRNRGKKKKHEKDEIEESGEDKATENIDEEVKKKFSSSVKESKVEEIEDKPAILDTPEELPNMAPTARKKKNKNKNANTEQSVKGEENVIRTPEPTQDLPVEISDVRVDTKLDVSSSKPIEEVKSAKKKNKKKKRHDSEKSDRTEEISCTAAFQQLIDIEDKKVDTTKTETECKTEISTDVPSEVETLITKQQEDIIDENLSKGNKNKKKGKKDKHNITKADIKEEDTNVPFESTSTVASEEQTKLLSDILSLDSSENIEESQIISKSAEKEVKPICEDVKPIAAIAKPVDKKRKEKSNQAIKEGESSEYISIVQLSKTEEENISGSKEHLKELPKCEEISKGDQVKEVMPLSLPEMSSSPHMGKNRKKSPKPPQKQLDPKQLQTEDAEYKESVSKDETPDDNEKISKQTKREQTEETISFEDTSKHNILETPIQVESKPDFTVLESATEETNSNVNLEIKSGKKRKKSPKPMKKLDIPENRNKKQDVKQTEPDTITEASDQSTESVRPASEYLKSIQSEDNINLYYDMPQMEDIEISSVKADESEGSTAEILPDIQYPRAASQQRVDDNNNTIIRDVSSPSDVKLGVPVFVPDTPFIKGGDIPLSSPELVASGIRVLDVEANVVKPSEEKTDIKSKMMEVNQDMEELRLSIEKSLAELTSMEKTEENVQKEYDEKSKFMELKPDSDHTNTTLLESKAIGEESQCTESAILMVQKKPLEAIMPAPSPPPKSNKKDKLTSEHASNPCLPVIPLPPPLPKKEPKPVTEEVKHIETSTTTDAPPVCPARKDNKGKGKSKKKCKQESGAASSVSESTSSSTEGHTSKEATQDTKKEEKKEEKPDQTKEKTKKQSDWFDENTKDIPESEVPSLVECQPIESFEDAMTSSADDVNQTFEMIASESTGSNVNPEINIIAPTEDSKTDAKSEKQNPVTPPKNLLGHPVIPVRSNKMDYKKEKNKTPNTILAKVKIKDSIEIQSKKQSKESQTDNIKKLMNKKSADESISTLNENEEFVYKYSFRKVYLPSVCHVCKKELKPMRVSCNYCHLLFYCNQKHKDEDWPHHQAFCFAVSTIVHLKDQKHIYEDAASVTGHSYRLLRMQMIVSCEKILKRKLVPWEQEALLYPRICGDVKCREWRLNKLANCDGCGQIAYCSENPDHLPRSHQRWCKSYSLYQKLVCYQQTRGRLEPKLPSRVMSGQYQVTDKINEVLAAMYKEKIDMNDVEYASLTQLATAPLTAVHSYQIYTNKMNSCYANGTYKKTSFTIHVVGAELQFEADALNKWEVFFLHLRPDIAVLRVCLIAPDLNPSKLPLDLLGKVKLCEQCRQDNRRLLFSFQDRMTYSEYYRSDDFTTPDIVCAFNPSIQRSSVYNGKDPWPATISCILKQKVPFVITSYTIEELRRDLSRIKECADFNTISDPKYNSFASVRPDRNFISDDEIPLLFKNYCFAVISCVF